MDNGHNRAISAPLYLHTFSSSHHSIFRGSPVRMISDVLYVCSLVSSSVLCNSMCILFTLRQNKISNENRSAIYDLFKLLVFSVQFQNISSCYFLLSFFLDLNPPIPSCIIVNINIINILIMLANIFLISFFNLLSIFSKKYKMMRNKQFLKNVSRFLVLFFPFFITFVNSLSCGINAFCSVHTKQRLNIWKVWADYESEQLREHVQCRVTVGKFFFPLLTFLIIIFTLSVLIRLLVTKISLRSLPFNNFIAPTPNIESIELPTLHNNTTSVVDEEVEEEEDAREKDNFSHITCIVVVLLVLTSYWLPRNYEILKSPGLMIYAKLYNVIYTTIIPIFLIFSSKDFRLFKTRDVQ